MTLGLGLGLPFYPYGFHPLPQTYSAGMQVRVLSLASFGAPASAESVNDDFSMTTGKLWSQLYRP